MEILGPYSRKVGEAEEDVSVPRVQQALKRKMKWELAMAEIHGLKFKYVMSANVFSSYDDLALSM